jgi:hypothetical protein
MYTQRQASVVSMGTLPMGDPEYQFVTGISVCELSVFLPTTLYVLSLSIGSGLLSNLFEIGNKTHKREMRTGLDIDFRFRRQTEPTDDIQEARDDNGGDDARALQEMVVLNSRGLAKETRGSSSLRLRPMNPSNQHAKASGRTLSSGGLQGGLSFCDYQHFPSSSKNEGHTLLSWEFESFCMERTIDPSSVNGETELYAFMRV